MTPTAFKQIKNNAKTKVVHNALNNTTAQLTFSVKAGKGSVFDQPGNGFYVTAYNADLYADASDDPQMRIGLCTARSGDSLTVTWGQFSTPIVALQGTPVVAEFLIAQHLYDVYQAINTVQEALPAEGSVIADFLQTLSAEAAREELLAGTKTTISVGLHGDLGLITNGSNDTALLQAAINGAATQGLTRINITSDLSITATVTLRDNIKIDLNGHKLTLANGTNDRMMYTPDTGLENFTMTNGTIDGNGANQTAGNYVVDIGGNTANHLKNITIDNIEFLNSRKHMIFFHGDTNGNHRKIIQNCTIDNHGVGGIGFAIYIDYAPNFVVERCTFLRNPGVSDVVEAGHLGLILVKSCFFKEGDINYPFGDNCIFDGNMFLKGRIINDTNTANNVTITNNTILDSNPAAGYGAIRVHGANARVQNNYVHTPINDGIRVQFGDGHIVSGNYCITDAITVGQGGIVSGNNTNNNQIFGNTLVNFNIAVRTTWDNNTFRTNFSIGCNIGLQLTSSTSSGHVIVGTRAFDNDFLDTTTPIDLQNQRLAYERNNLGVPEYVTLTAASTTLTILHKSVALDATSNSVAVTLPSAANVAGKRLVITSLANGGGFTSTVNRAGTDQIRRLKADSLTSLTLLAGDIIVLQSFGTYWQVVQDSKYIFTTNQDIEITDTTKGLILRSPDGARWRVTIDNTGVLQRTSL